MSSAAVDTPHARGVDMKLEVIVIPVSDVDRAKRFYSDWMRTTPRMMAISVSSSSRRQVLGAR